MDEKIVVLEGSVENIIYKNAENGYTVFSLLGVRDETVCVGNVVDLIEGETMTITGFFVVHPFYGKQLCIKSYEKNMPQTELGIERYLGSGVIKGIGAKMAKRIVDRFGDDTFDIIENNPEKLAEIKGISKEKALIAAEAYMKQIELKKVMIFLQSLGVSNNYAIKIFKEYKNEAIDIIKSNPYKIADDIYGIGFKTADGIAEKVGVSKNSVYRIKSGIKYTLNLWAGYGHTFMPKDKLFEQCSELLEIDVKYIDGALVELQIETQIIQKTFGNADVVFLNYYYHAENNCAKKIAALSCGEDDAADSSDIDSDIRSFELQNGISLADRQKEAVREAMHRGVLVITGGPGTGKTTTINALISILEKRDKKIILAAPTGRAAKRMTEATGRPAQTIHRLLQVVDFNDENMRHKFDRDEQNPLEGDVIIIDEMSMVDILLLNSLLKASPSKARLIFVGDVDQLPSVGAGNVLSDIIKSGCVKVVLLNEIFRQAQKSDIVMNAHRINKGEMPILSKKDSDFFFMKRETVEGTVSTILQLILERLPTYANIKRPSDIQVLTPMRKSVLGVNELNRVLQESLNPPSPKKKERELRQSVFREGDKVMQIKNNYNLSWIIKDNAGNITDEGSGIFNGDQGYIEEIDAGDEIIIVLFDDGKIVSYDYSQADELELAYSVTIHKSQGSEYPVVIIPILTGPFMLMTRNLLYTAVTRAKSLVIIIGSAEKIESMVNNNMEILRYSALKEQLIKAFSLLL